jgi:thioester reductase-like protein
LKIKENVQIIIHGAATLDFDEPLDQAILHNVEATLELFELARECKKLEAFTHISTAYVSSNIRGFVKEIPHPLKDGKDVEKALQKFRSMSPQDIQAQSATILRANAYPNTYTYTKCLAEHLLIGRRRGVPLIIIRPTIIGSAFKEPVEGWIDAVMAAGGRHFLIMRYLTLYL